MESLVLWCGQKIGPTDVVSELMTVYLSYLPAHLLPAHPSFRKAQVARRLSERSLEKKKTSHKWQVLYLSYLSVLYNRMATVSKRAEFRNNPYRRVTFDSKALKLHRAHHVEADDIDNTPGH